MKNILGIQVFQYWSVYAFISIFLISACELMAPSMQQRYVSDWSARLDEYRANFVAEEVKIREETKKFNLEQENNSVPWDTVVSKVFELNSMIREAYTIAGRGETIKAFIAHMQNKPTPGLSDGWFIRQTEDVQNEAREVDLKTQTFLQSFSQKPLRGTEWIREVENLTKAQGRVAGKIQELQSLHKQAMSYYQDVEREKVTALQKSQALMATAGYLNQLNYQQQFLNTLNRPHTCTSFGRMMTCN